MDKILNFLYTTFTGRVILKGLTAKKVSKACGAFLDSPMSKPLIKPFVEKNDIDLSICERDKAADYDNFNDFFTRQLKDGERPIGQDETRLIAPSDGLLSAYIITEGLVIPVKRSCYRVSDLLHSKKLAKEYNGGLCLVYRLSVKHYHRYVYAESGIKGKNHRINGILHTVQPIALRHVPVFTENQREFVQIKTKNFGKIIQMEVGALLVGKIKNHHLGIKNVKRGEEKGFFKYGGSTIIVLIKKDHIGNIDPKYYINTLHNIETPVKMGQYL